MLCGIYCATRIIACYKVASTANEQTQAAVYEDAAQNAFHYLLESTEDLKLLTAKKLAHPIVGGFTDLQLEKIFNNVPVRKRLGLQALSFRRSSFKSLANSERRSHVIDFNSCAIIKEDGDRHWITVEGLDKDGDYACFDPELPDTDEILNRSKRKRIAWDQGVLIGNQQIIWNINAKKN